MEALEWSNFSFLTERWPLLADLGEAGERNLHPDPNTTLFKLRLFGEKMARIIYAEEKPAAVEPHNQNERLRVLGREADLPREVISMFHSLRQKGNDAVHEGIGTIQEAKSLLKIAHKLSVWFMQTYGDWDFRPEPYREPEPRPEPEAIRREIEEKYRKEQEQRERELEQKLAAELERMRLSTLSHGEMLNRRAQARRAADRLDLTEEETRRIIDEQLAMAGWEADSRRLRYARGARPEKGKNQAIAEWPTACGPADYALFIGLRLVGLVEAKKISKNIPSDLEQAKEYARHVEVQGEEEGITRWGDYRVPFVFATNGRDYFQQVEEQSGIWYQDLRSRRNRGRALPAWFSPEDLQEKLSQDEEQALERLAEEEFGYLGLRPYQEQAIQAVERGIREGRRELLLAMATGTGKTRTAIGLLYRLIKSKTCRRILFLVDRTALGEQAENAFKESPLENYRTFAQIFELQGLQEKVPHPETKVHIQTVQGMVSRLFKSGGEAGVPSVGLYDCIIVDEAHRGYKLDKEMGEVELLFRDQKEYISQYRRVLDHFDAVKIGLTATPALHTREIFGDPIFNYTYREAVVDGYLVDHTPPHQLTTRLAKEGIRWQVGESVEVYDEDKQSVEKIDRLEDEVNIEVDQFNKAVITRSFNETVLDEVAQHLDLENGKKALIFAASDKHADMVTEILREKLWEWQEEEERAVLKITSSVHDSLEAIRRFKNEAYPKVAVTVDLLTTGIDVPEICTLVFLRRIKSRVLYEQMLGRATRPCERVGKEFFEIFDPVRLYEALEPFTRMKPATVNPQVSFTQLVAEMREVDDKSVQNRYRNTLLGKLNRKQRFFQEQERKEFQNHCGRTVEEMVDWIRNTPPEEVAEKLEQEAPLLTFLDQRRPQPRRKYISNHPDELLSHRRGYGDAERPEDYLEAFGRFLKENENKLPALRLVCQRPSDLTRESLKELKRELAKAGYRETTLRTAWNEMTNEEIAADIISFIRQRLLKEPLVSHEERVRGAMDKLRRSQQWTVPQKRWLDRIEKVLKQESVLGADAERVFNEEPFKDQGGYRRINKIFHGQAQSILNRINQHLFASEKGRTS
ncbi:type I restriction-modification system endonuclease [Kroppenstedtia eburnea]|uniref:type I restriction-modification system endonuclease n=1 Tax=Kroppenstedtia eburnea TaxID=714067 RepID=UPI003645DDB1